MSVRDNVVISHAIRDPISDDINDAFNDIALAENKSFDVGFNLGVDAARKQGFYEGFKLGLGKGLQIGTTVGYYKKFAEIHLELLGKKQDSNNRGCFASFPVARLEKLELSFLSLLEPIKNLDCDQALKLQPDESSSSITDAANPHIFDQLSEIEAKFKRVKALLNLKVASTTTNSQSKSEKPKLEF